jgi:hypothetical protein
MEAIQCFNILLPGPKMIWQFEELGYDYSINTCSDGVTISENCRTEAKPVRWDYRDNPNRYRIHEVVSGLCKLKHEHPSTFNTNNYNWDVGGYGKRLHLNSSMNATVVANFKVDAIQMIPGFQHTGQWWDYFTGESFTVSDVNAFMSFAPGEYHVYVDEALDFPSTSPETIALDAKRATSLYPNPAMERTIWTVPIDPRAAYQFGISNNLGQSLTHQVRHHITSDGQSIELEFGNLSDGIYHVEVTQGNKRFSDQLVLQSTR